MSVVKSGHQWRGCHARLGQPERVTGPQTPLSMLHWRQDSLNLLELFNAILEGRFSKGYVLEMPTVTVYTADHCCYCHMAKDLLRRKGAAFEEVDVTGRNDLRKAMISKAGGRNTVPQIWIGEMHVGGCDDLYALDRSGKLDTLLAR